MSNVFFVDWELWQQMSFVLAIMIVLVMIAGVIRLQYLTWKSKKIVMEDEEKKARLSEVRSTGLRVRRDKDIPFGVRAIESGIEVDGIWISRPTTPVTPTEKRFASLTTLVTDDIQNKGKEAEGPDLIDTSSPTASPRLSPNDYYRPKQPSQLRTGSDSNAVKTPGAIECYNPQQQRRPGPPSQRTSGSSEYEQSQHQAYFPTLQYTRPARDYSPSVTSSRGNTRTPDPFTTGSRTNSLSGYPTMEYTESNNGMPHPPRIFVPGQQTRR